MFYNDLEDIEEAVRSLNPTVLHTFEASCFNGIYITPEVNVEYLQSLEMKRGNGRHGAASPSLPPLSRTTSLTNNAAMISYNHTATTNANAGICSSNANNIYTTVLRSSSPAIISSNNSSNIMSSNSSSSVFSAHVFSNGVVAQVSMPHSDSRDEYASVDGNHNHDNVVLQWSNDDVISSNEHYRIVGNEYTSSSSSSSPSSSSSSSASISLRAAIQEAVSIAEMIPQPPPYQLTSPPVSPHKALLPHPRTHEVNRYDVVAAAGGGVGVGGGGGGALSSVKQTTFTRQSFNNALLEPDVIEPDQLLDNADSSRSADGRNGGDDDDGRPTMDSFSQSLLLLSPKKVQRGYFHAVVEDGQQQQHHEFYDTGGSGSCEPLHNG